MPIRMIVGLGNPGGEYEATRHNVGFWFVDGLAERHHVSFRAESKFFGEVAKVDVAGESVWLLKPMTYMNRSGQAVAALARYYKIEPDQILVAHDELDHEAGVMRLKLDGGHAGHNGLRDIIAQLGTKAFYRVRIGIGHPGHKSAVTNYVLGRPSKVERNAMEDVLSRLDQLLPQIVEGEIPKVMNELHRS